MARIRKRGKAWNVEVRRKGVPPQYAAFPTKAEALEWAAETERKIRAGGVLLSHSRTVGDALEKYAEEVSPKKAGDQWEQKRIAWLLKQPFASLAIGSCTPATLAAWRDSRLKSVSGETVRREMTVLSHCLSIATREWRWIAENPMKMVSRPKGNPGRERIATDEEIETLCYVSGYKVGTTPTTACARTVAAFVFAVETGMRGGEICELRAGDRAGNCVRLSRSKNGERREVALSGKARAVLSDVGGAFGLTARQKDALFRKIRQKAGIEGLTFHDSRHTAITRLAKKLNALELARMVGHKDLSMLLRYYNESAEEIAKRL